jgi:hypothetical protein
MVASFASIASMYRCIDGIDHHQAQASGFQAFSLSRALLSQALIIVYIISAIKRSSAFRHPHHRNS